MNEEVHHYGFLDRPAPQRRQKPVLTNISPYGKYFNKIKMLQNGFHKLANGFITKILKVFFQITHKNCCNLQT